MTFELELSLKTFQVDGDIRNLNPLMASAIPLDFDISND
jgi:hypothetical protein